MSTSNTNTFTDFDLGEIDFIVYPTTHPVIYGMSSSAGGFAYRCHMSSREKNFMCQTAFNETGIPISDYSAWSWLKDKPDMQKKYNVEKIFAEEDNDNLHL
jgi:hypothetical protein